MYFLHSGELKTVYAGPVYVYSIPPIDHWDDWTDIKPDNATVAAFYRAAQDVALQGHWKGDCSWEGDERSGESHKQIILLPDTEANTLVVALKQDNNGTTFVASPHALPWLTDRAYGFVSTEKHNAYI